MAPSLRTRPESPREWSPEDVVEFLTDPKAVGLPQSAAAAFSANQIDGRALLELTTEEVRSELGLVLGHRKTLFRAISRLKAMSKVTATKADQNSAQSTSSLPGTAVSSSARKSDAAANSPESPASRETSAPVGATSATPRSATTDTAEELTCAGCGCTKPGELFSSRQRKIAAHKPARCIECAQAGAAATSSRSAPTELQPYLARELRPAEAAGYKASGVLPMRLAHDGTLEVLLALERRQDWAIRGRADKGAAKSKAEQDNAGDSKTLLAASGRVEGNFLHPIGGTRETDDEGAVATAAREFAEEVGHVLSTEAEGSKSAALAQASTEMLKGARGRYVLWQPRGKYALWVYFLPTEQEDVANKFAAWKAKESKETQSATNTAGEQRMLDVRWVPVSMDGTVQIDQHTKPETVDGQIVDGRLATSFRIELLQRKALRQHLAQTARRFLRLQLSVASASPGKGSGNVSTSSPLAQSPMLAVAAEALLSKRLAAATPSPTQKQQRKSKKRKAGDAPSQSDESRPKDAPAEGESAAASATAAASEADDAAARKRAKKAAKKQRKQLTKAKRKSEHSPTEDNDEGEGSADNGAVKRLRADEMESKKKRKAESTVTGTMNSHVEIQLSTEAASDKVEQRPMPDGKEVKEQNKEVSTAAESKNSQQKDTAAATVDQTASADRSQAHQQLFVEDREGSRADTDHAATGTDAVGGAVVAAAPKTLNRAVRKQQRKLAHAERLRAKAAAANSEAAAVLVTSATKKNATRAAKRTQAVLTVSKAAPASDTTVAEPLPSPRALGKFRFTGTGLQIG